MFEIARFHKDKRELTKKTITELYVLLSSYSCDVVKNLTIFTIFFIVPIYVVL